MKRVITERFPLSSVSSGKYYLILFIIWPFAAFLSAIVNYSQKESRRTVYFFLIYYGLTFVNENVAVDAYRYALGLKANALLPFSDFFKIIGGLNTDTSVDIVEPLISFIVSRLTSHSGLYFAVWAAIFGFFYLKSVNLLNDRYQENRGINAMILMLFFVMILPITSISGVRMWTAAWIFFFGAYHVVLYRKPVFLLVSMGAALVHWSFISANVILLIYFFSGNRNLVYIPIVIISFIIPRFISPLLQSVSLRLGGGLQTRVQNYTSEGYILSVQESGEQVAWFMKTGSNLVFYYLIIAIVFVQLRYGALLKGREEKNLFSFLLLFVAFVNFGMPIPSFGGRFQILFFLFATLYLFICYSKFSGNKISPLILAGLFPMLLFTLINFRIGSESINAWIFTPLLGSPLFTPILSVSELIFR
jgi:hypothetical protein